MTLTKVYKSVPHGGQPGISFFTLAFVTPDAYATNGITVDLSSIGFVVPFNQLLAVRPAIASDGKTSLWVAGTDFTNGKLKMFSGASEVTNATSLNGISVSLEIVTGVNLI